jgi:hypothetical protein
VHRSKWRSVPQRARRDAAAKFDFFNQAIELHREEVLDEENAKRACRDIARALKRFSVRSHRRSVAFWKVRRERNRLQPIVQELGLIERVAQIPVRRSCPLSEWRKSYARQRACSKEAEGDGLRPRLIPLILLARPKRTETLNAPNLATYMKSVPTAPISHINK